MINKIFNFNSNELRVFITDNNEPYFVAKDICDVLGYSNSNDAVIRHCKSEGVVKHDILTNGGTQNVSLINEGNLYRLILKSKKKEAEKFESWVCDEVLTSIRKNGIYATESTINKIISDPSFGIQLLQTLQQEREEKRLLQNKIKKDEIRTQFVNRVIASEDMVDVGQCAKILELPFGRNTLFSKLREMGVFFKNTNEPKQIYIEKGYFKLKEKFIETESHGTKAVIKVLVTQKGLGYLNTLFEAEPSSKKQLTIQ